MAEQYNTNYTFQQLVDEVKNYIKTNCINISDFNSISETLKSGYTTAIKIGGQYTAGSVNYYYTNCAIVANAVGQATTDQVDIDMANYLNSIGRTNLTETIPEIEVLQFLEELAVFCYNHCWFLNGQFTTSNIFVYASGDRSDIQPLPRTYFNLIKATDMLQLLNNFTTNIKPISRQFTAKYRYTWNWSPKSESGQSTTNVWYIL